MKFTRLGAFTLGVVITVVSVGAVSFVNAAGDATLKACANKTSGTMRYISKGSCKKTETSLSWNQMGPQGLSGSSGIAGAKGDTGSAGTKGDSGAAGNNGTALRVIDATGKDMGLLVSHEQREVTVLLDNKIWDLSIYTTNQASGNLNSYDYFFTDSGCAQLLPVVTVLTAPSQSVLNFNVKYWTVSAVKPFSTQVSIFERVNGVCTQLNAARIELLENDVNIRVAVIEEIKAPTYTAPLTIVAK